MKYVYIGKDKPVKQIVWLGDQNENHVLIKKGLKEGDVVWLTEPANAGELDIKGLEIYAEMKKEKEDARLQAEKDRNELKPAEVAEPITNPATLKFKALPNTK
jgi:hypothetical protein